jgi:hypothetical protein
VDRREGEAVVQLGAGSDVEELGERSWSGVGRDLVGTISVAGEGWGELVWSGSRAYLLE